MEKKIKSAKFRTIDIRQGNRTLIVLLAVALVLAVGMSGYFYYNYQQSMLDPQARMEERNEAETHTVLNRLNDILLVDTEDQPTVAKVEDVEKLKQSNEEFYKNVEQGDYLILYPEQAIIYRMDENKIINIAPIVDVKSSSQEEEKARKNDE